MLACENAQQLCEKTLPQGKHVLESGEKQESVKDQPARESFIAIGTLEIKTII